MEDFVVRVSCQPAGHSRSFARMNKKLGVGRFRMTSMGTSKSKRKSVVICSYLNNNSTCSNLGFRLDRKLQNPIPSDLRNVVIGVKFSGNITAELVQV